MTDAKDDKAPDSSPERRSEPRHLACFPAAVAKQDGGNARTAFIRDLSIGGARLLTVNRFDVGQRLGLALHLPGLDEPRAISATVVRDERRPEEVAYP